MNAFRGNSQYTAGARPLPWRKRKEAGKAGAHWPRKAVMKWSAVVMVRIWRRRCGWLV